MAPRVSLETLIDRAVTRSGYDRHLLALPAGDRRMANVRKLMRMAREFEADEGRDLRRFIDFVAERDLVRGGEGQAPLEAEDLDAVRLMTVHRAKGLEFPLVCVADLGKTGREDDAALRVTDDGRLGMRLASLSGESVDSAEMERIRQEQKADDEEEERRIFYVAATRAGPQEHLVLSGATDLEKLQEPADLAEPMRWIWRALAPRLDEMDSQGVVTGDYDGRELRVACRVLRPADVDALLPAADRRPVPPEPEPPGLEALAAPALAAVPVPAALPVSRLSYSGLAAYRRCGYRFYLDRALRLPPPDDDPARAARAATARMRCRRSCAEWWCTSCSRSWTSRLPRCPPTSASPRRSRPSANRCARTRLPTFAAWSPASWLHRWRCGSARPSAFTPSCRSPSPWTPARAQPAHRRNTWACRDGARGAGWSARGGLQERPARRWRARGSGRGRLRDPATGVRAGSAALGCRPGGGRLLLPGAPGRTGARIYTAADMPDLEAELRELTAGVSEGRFEPTAEPHRGLCADCPGRPALCSWDEERTLAEPVATSGSARSSSGQFRLAPALP